MLIMSLDVDFEECNMNRTVSSLDILQLESILMTFKDNTKKKAEVKTCTHRDSYTI